MLGSLLKIIIFSLYQCYEELLLLASFTDKEKEYKDIEQLMQVTIPHFKLLTIGSLASAE